MNFSLKELNLCLYLVKLFYTSKFVRTSADDDILTLGNIRKKDVFSFIEKLEKEIENIVE